MGGWRFERVFLGVVLLLAACGSSGGQTTDGGNGSGGSGSKGSGGAGGQASGTGGSGASCPPTVSPCGGNIVGTWKVTQYCVTTTQVLSSAGSGCTGATATYQFFYSGSLTFNTDGTFDSAVTGGATVTEQFPSGCNPFGFTCQQLGQSAMDAGTGTCSADATGGCTCDVATKALMPASPTGTYSVSGSTLTTVDNGNATTNSYCVQGASLYEMADRQDGGTISMGEIMFTKQ